jgi:hypothetical protein
MARRIPELSMIELKRTSGIADYCSASRNLARDFAAELDGAGNEIYAALSRMHGHPLMLGIDVKIKARKVRRRFFRARDCAAGAGIECVKAWHTFQVEFGALIAPQVNTQKRPSFDFKS